MNNCPMIKYENAPEKNLDDKETYTHELQKYITVTSAAPHISSVSLA